ncbi:Fic family protein [bacterium]|nr:Fic family protein [bacterium]
MDKLLSEIKEQKVKLAKLLKNKNNKKQFEKWLKTELAYTSNAIEGNTLTRKETQLVIEENLTSSAKPLKNYIEAVNHAKAFNKILEIIENNNKISEKEILDIHRTILIGLDDLNAGFYRDCRVRISGSNVILPNPLKVPELMINFYKWLDNNIENEPTTAITAHLKFVSIHPFADGNGRTARLLMNLLLLKYGYAPIIVRPTDRKKYLSAIENFQTKGDEKTYTKLMFRLLNRSFKIIINMFETEQKESKKLVTISKYAKLKGVPASTIRYWVEIGKIKPTSYTNSGYMLFDIDN